MSVVENMGCVIGYYELGYDFDGELIFSDLIIAGSWLMSGDLGEMGGDGKLRWYLPFTFYSWSPASVATRLPAVLAHSPC